MVKRDNSFMKGQRDHGDIEFLLGQESQTQGIHSQRVLPAPVRRFQQPVVNQSPHQAVGLALAEAESSGDFQDGKDRAGGIEQEQNFQTVGQGLIHFHCHHIENGIINICKT